MDIRQLLIDMMAVAPLDFEGNPKDEFGRVLAGESVNKDSGEKTALYLDDARVNAVLTHGYTEDVTSDDVANLLTLAMSDPNAPPEDGSHPTFNVEGLHRDYLTRVLEFVRQQHPHEALFHAKAIMTAHLNLTGVYQVAVREAKANGVDVDRAIQSYKDSFSD